VSLHHALVLSGRPIATLRLGLQLLLILCDEGVEVAEEAEYGLTENVIKHAQMLRVELNSHLLHHIWRHLLLLAFPLIDYNRRGDSLFLLLLFDYLFVILAGLNLHPYHLIQIG
jgi:hypothetical protein